MKPAASAPAVKHTASPVLSSAQPCGQLAFTGSDISLPLTVGLHRPRRWAVGLTALGRRRQIRDRLIDRPAASQPTAAAGRPPTVQESIHPHVIAFLRARDVHHPKDRNDA